MTMDTKGTVIRRAQQGQRMLEALPPGGPRGEARQLEAPERYRLVDTFTTLLGELYVHLPLKRAMYGKDPIQRLRLLRQRAADLPDADFHSELSGILTDLRDAHTRYVGPDSQSGRVAVLPFMIEQFGRSDAPRFIVSNMAEGDPAFDGTPFAQGVEILFWNGVPIARTVDRHADRETGGRPDARRARALESLTFRSLRYGPPPDEYWVDIVFRPDGEEHEVRVEWRIIDVDESAGSTEADTGAYAAFAVDPAAEAIRRAKTLLFAPAVWYEARAGAATPVDTTREPPPGEWITGHFQENVAAKKIETPSGQFGYLRLWSFDLIDDEGYVQEVISLLKLLPKDGLIIDLRGNPGGLIWAAERLLQLFTPRRITPTRFSVVATDLTRAMAQAPQNEVHLEPWRRSLEMAVVNGEPYSRSVPLTPPSLCNNIGQQYSGPVVAVVDPNTYSAGDLFAAGVVDNRIGTLVSIGEATGAGGANVWYPAQVTRAVAGTPYQSTPLPLGIGYTLSFRRAVRTGSADGVVIEDLGIPGHLRYDLTHEDLTNHNADLMAFCGRLLASEPVTGLEVQQRRPQELRVTPMGLDRVDVYVDDHPLTSLKVEGPIDVELPSGWFAIDVAGYVGGTLRQRRLLTR
jgi:hypothetical protein